MATINEVIRGLELLAEFCDGSKCKVNADNKHIAAGDDVPRHAAETLEAFGWRLGEFGWEIECG